MMKFSRRVIVGWVLLLATGLIIGAVRLRAEQPSPAQTHYTFGEASLFFETDRTTVWGIGDCVTLHWKTDQIKAIYLNRQPTVGENTTQWCATQQAFDPPFTVNLTDGSTKYFTPFELSTVRSRIILTLLPLFLIAGWCLRLHLLAARTFEYLPSRLRMPYTVQGKVQPILVVLFLLINAIVLWNAFTIRGAMGYDHEGHYDNVKAIASGHLPTAQESAEFFSPPMSYLFPAMVRRFITADDDLVRKVGQLQNILVSLASTFLLLRLCARLYPDRLTPRAAALLLLGMLTVYYKSFAFMRGEPFVVLFTLLLCDQFLTLLRRRPNPGDALLIGLYGGLLLLSRQWGALVLIGAVLWWIFLLLQQRNVAIRLITTGVAAGVLAVLLGGWFYLNLAVQSGSALAFNRPADTTAKPLTFFTGLGGPNLLSYPFSPGFDGQALPIFYTELWGDYFGYFYIERPPIPMRFPVSELRLMGLANALGVLPTLVLAGGMFYGCLQMVRSFSTPSGDAPVMRNLYILIILASLAGFFWFLRGYPSNDADTAKATYQLHIFPLLCLLSGELLERVEMHWPRLFRSLIVGLSLVMALSFPIYFTRIR